MNPRRGFTIVELMIAMTASSVLLVVSVGLIHRAMTLHVTARQQDALQHAALRLSRQVRSDLRRAESAAVAGDELRLTFPASDSAPQATYVASPELVVREQLHETGPPRREAFRFPRCAQIEFSELNTPERIGLTVWRNGPAEGTPPRVVLQLEATVGRRAQFAASERESP